MSLGCYVLYGTQSPVSYQTIKGQVMRDMRRASGRYQVEILIRSANEAIDNLRSTDVSGAEKEWNTIADCCRHLGYYHRNLYHGPLDNGKFKHCESSCLIN